MVILGDSLYASRQGLSVKKLKLKLLLQLVFTKHFLPELGTLVGIVFDYYFYYKFKILK